MSTLQNIPQPQSFAVSMFGKCLETTKAFVKNTGGAPDPDSLRGFGATEQFFKYETTAGFTAFYGDNGSGITCYQKEGEKFREYFRNGEWVAESEYREFRREVDARNRFDYSSTPRLVGTVTGQAEAGERILFAGSNGSLYPTADCTGNNVGRYGWVHDGKRAGEVEFLLFEEKKLWNGQKTLQTLKMVRVA